MRFPLSELRFWQTQRKQQKYKKNDFDRLINNDKYQVFFFECTAFFPFAFASHPWFVLNKKGNISRWEVLLENEVCQSSWGHLHLNASEPYRGVGIFPYFNKICWRPKLKSMIEDGKAKEMIKFIERSKENYPYCDRYALSGPNSNTYAQMILDNFPQAGMSLSRRAIGKNFKES